MVKVKLKKLVRRGVDKTADFLSADDLQLGPAVLRAAVCRGIIRNRLCVSVTLERKAAGADPFCHEISGDRFSPVL